MKTPTPKGWLLIALPVLLTACAASAPSTMAPTQAAPNWHNSLPDAATATSTPVLVPHSGRLADLSDWWSSLSDPFLVELIGKAQALSPSVSAAKSRLVQARAGQVQAAAAGGPLADASLGLSRGITTVGNPVATGLIGSAQASWELDLFGGVKAGQDAAAARLDGSMASWHAARVSVAAEVAQAYFGLKACERLAGLSGQQAASVAESARLTQLLVNAGMVSASQGASLQLVSTQAQAGLAQSRAQCRSLQAGLVALTGVDSKRIASKTAFEAGQPLVASVRLPVVPLLPAQLLTQRPDVFSAQTEVAAASHDVGVANANRYPRLGLSGSITGYRARTSGQTTDLLTWSIGPLAISLPLLDGGQRAAASDAAVARYDDAVNRYQAGVRQAVMEVEDALNKLQGAGEQSEQALLGAKQVALVLSATQAKFDQGMASKIELEDAKRQALSAQATVYTLEKDRIAAWVDLYRALGGGWQPEPRATAASVAPMAQTAQ